MSFEDWKRKNSATLQGKTDDQIWELYTQYEKGSNIDPTINSTIEDVSDKKTPSYLQQTNTANNIDMLGTTDFLTQIGVTTNNSTLTKAGLLGSTAVNAIQQFKGLKGLKGTNKVAGISGVAGGVATLDENSKLPTSQLPGGIVTDPNYVHTDNNFTNALLTKLETISLDIVK